MSRERGAVEFCARRRIRLQRKGLPRECVPPNTARPLRALFSTGIPLSLTDTAFCTRPVLPDRRPVEKCFPCIDMCRLAALHPHLGEVMAADGDRLIKAVATKLAEGKDLVSPCIGIYSKYSRSPLRTRFIAV